MVARSDDSKKTDMDRKFVRHVAGMMAFMEWQDRWKTVERSLRWKGPILDLHDVASQRWGLACPRHPGAARHPTLLVQSEERRWLERLAWRSALFNPVDGHLALLSPSWQTPAGSWPGFAVILRVAPASKWQWLASTGTLEARPIWWDASDAAHVSHGPALARWSLRETPSEQWLSAIHESLSSNPLLAAQTEEDARSLLSRKPRQGDNHVGTW